MDTIHFASEHMCIGAFRCSTSSARFEDSGPIGGYLIVFPRTGVYITYAGGSPIVADPNVVMFYNHGQEYRRSKLSDRGDCSDWFAFEPQLVRDAIACHDPGVAGRSDRLFTLTHAPSDPHTYVRQRHIVERLLRAEPSDPMFVEEAMLSVLGAALDRAYRAWGQQPARAAAEPSKLSAELMHAVKELLAVSFRERLSLDDIARRVYCSPYHLCRLFHQQTGTTIHRYLVQLRLRTALEYVSEPGTDLATLGAELGFASHSHFTQAFRSVFGSAPSALRRSMSQ